MTSLCYRATGFPASSTGHVVVARSSTVSGGVFGIVLLLHAGLSLFILSTTAKPPVRNEAPLMVQFLEAPNIAAPAPTPVAAQPLPVALRPQPVTLKTTPKPVRKPETRTLPLETTTSAEPSAGPVAAAASSAPETPAAPGNAGNVGGASTASGKGGEVDSVGARFDADYLKNPAPPYPAASRRLREEGKVILRVSVTAEGVAENVEIRTSSGSARLDESALRTVRQWKFVPAKRGDTPVQSSVLVPIVFKLES